MSGWEKCGHGLTSRPRRVPLEAFLDQLLLLFQSPPRSSGALHAGTLPLRYCSTGFACRTPFGGLPVPGHVAGLVAVEVQVALQAHVSRSAWVELAASLHVRVMWSVHTHTFNGVPNNHHNNNHHHNHNHHNHKAQTGCVGVFFSCCPMDESCMQPTAGVARRRRERRLRMHWRHEQLYGPGCSDAQRADQGKGGSGGRGGGRAAGKAGDSTVASAMSSFWLLMSPVLQMVEQPVDASPLAFFEEAEANDLEVEYMKLVRGRLPQVCSSGCRRSCGGGTCSARRVVGGRRRGGRSVFPRSLVHWLVPGFYALLGFTVGYKVPASVPEAFLGRIPHSFYVMVVLALYASGNLDFLRTTGTWHPPLFGACHAGGTQENLEFFWDTTTQYSTTLCI